MLSILIHVECLLLLTYQFLNHFASVVTLHHPEQQLWCYVYRRKAGAYVAPSHMASVRSRALSLFFELAK